MVFTLVSLVKLLHQAAMGWVPTLEYVLSSAHGLLRPCPILPGA
jgi:hypothetical protein